MIFSIDFINKTLALGTVLADAGILASIVYLVFFRKQYPLLLKFFGQYGLLFSFLIASVATGSSLYYSQIAGFAPCDLCWIQRIFIYPLVILLGAAVLKKDRGIIDYVLWLCVGGFLVSLYHNYMNWGGVQASCAILNSGVSCIKRYVFELGYVTIPMMALTAFSLIIILLLYSKLSEHDKRS